MRRWLEQYVNSSLKKIIDTYELESFLKEKCGEQYPGEVSLAEEVRLMVDEGILTPVLSRKSYGQAGALCGGYRIVTRNIRRRAHVAQVKELAGLHPLIATTQYEHDAEKWKRDVRYIKSIDAFLRKEMPPDRSQWLTVSQRSFQLFRDEYFLTRRKGVKLLQDLALTYEDLACYQPVEPFIYARGPEPRTVDRILIVEHRDVFHMLQPMLWHRRREEQAAAAITMLIFGEREKIAKRLPYCDELPFLQEKERGFYYFGDISYDSFSFLARLRDDHAERFIQPYVPFYQLLLERHEKDALIQRVVNRNKEHDEQVAALMDFFPPDIARVFQGLFRSNKYIPQIALDGQSLQLLRASL